MESEELSKKTWLPAGLVLEERWVLGEPLGRGGFASVYEGRHLKLGRRVAVKVLDIQANPDDLIVLHQRFLREAKTAAQLEHANVVQILDYGLAKHSGTEKPFLVMELLDGHDLEHELLSNGTLAPERASKLFAGALDALAASHDMGIVHRDLKPSNLYLVHPGQEDERLVVVDFGIARAFEDKDAKLTSTSHFTGTPAYLAPEYISEQKVSPALDVYQMGLIITESLTGKPVVQASAPLGYLVAHCNGQQKIPDYLENTEIGKLLRRAVSVEPEARPKDARALREALATLDWNEVEVAHAEYIANLDPTFPDMAWTEDMTFDEGVVPASLQNTSPDRPEALDAQPTMDFEDDADSDVSGEEPATPADTPEEPAEADAKPVKRTSFALQQAVSEPEQEPEPMIPEPLDHEPPPKQGGVPVWVVGVLVIALIAAVGVAAKFATQQPEASTSPTEVAEATTSHAQTDELAETSSSSKTPPENNAQDPREGDTTPVTATDLASATTSPETSPAEEVDGGEDIEKSAPRGAKRAGKGAKTKLGSRVSPPGTEPVTLLAPQKIDKKLGYANSVNRLILGEVVLGRKSFLSAMDRYQDDRARVADAFNDVERYYRTAASALRKAAKASPASPDFDAKALAMASALDGLADVMGDGYHFRVKETPAADLPRLDQLEARYKTTFAAFEKALPGYRKAYYELEIKTFEERFAKTHARRSPIMHHFHGFLLESSRAMAKATNSGDPMAAKRNMKAAVLHARKFAEFDLRKFEPELPSSVKNTMFGTYRGIDSLQLQLRDFSSLDAKTKLQSKAKAEQTIANQWYRLHMARGVQMRRYFERSF